jgi:phage-related minor tail protein
VEAFRDYISSDMLAGVAESLHMGGGAGVTMNVTNNNNNVTNNVSTSITNQVANAAQVEQVAKRVVDLIGNKLQKSVRSNQSTPSIVRMGG